MRKRPPIEYISPLMAGTRLLSAAMDILARSQRGITVHWELKVKFKYGKDHKPWPGTVALPMGGTMVSGSEWDEDAERAKAEERLSKGEPAGDED